MLEKIFLAVAKISERESWLRPGHSLTLALEDLLCLVLSGFYQLGKGANPLRLLNKGLVLFKVFLEEGKLFATLDYISFRVSRVILNFETHKFPPVAKFGNLAFGLRFRTAETDERIDPIPFF